jgi:macrolide phosphotransferase
VPFWKTLKRSQETPKRGVAMREGHPFGAYPGAMNHTPLMLSALATSAVQGFQAVSAQSLSTPERDAALVHDVNNVAWLIEIPLSDADALAHSDDLSATKALTEGLRSRLPFQVPKVLGTTQVGARTLSVSAYLPGLPLTPQSVTPASAASFGQTLAAIHALPTSSMADFDRPVFSTLDALRESAGVVDSAAATGLLPQSLLRRWETACEDQGLWQCDAMAIHGQVQLGRFLTADHKVVAVDGWTRFSQGDPAQDMAWLTTPANSAFATAVTTAYQQQRPTADRWIMHRARFYAELDVARWLLHGIGLGNETIVRDATDMLAALNDRVAGDMDSALTARISDSKHPITGV